MVGFILNPLQAQKPLLLGCGCGCRFRVGALLRTDSGWERNEFISFIAVRTRWVDGDGWFGVGESG